MFVFSSRRRHTRCALVTGVQTCALPILGFTYCPDGFPTTLAELAQAQKQWETLTESTRPRVLFVSVDPERDDPDRIGEYAHAFHRDSMAATAAVPALEKFANSLAMVFATVPTPEGHQPDRYTTNKPATPPAANPPS